MESVHILLMVFKTLYTENNKEVKNLKFSRDKKMQRHALSINISQLFLLYISEPTNMLS